jgi:transposase-like protein
MKMLAKPYLQARRWPDGVHCPRCGNPKVYDLKTRKWHWQCAQCAPTGYRFSIIAGTIFENTNKPLRDWYRVIHLMLTSKKGMSARQVWWSACGLRLAHNFVQILR